MPIQIPSLARTQASEPTADRPVDTSAPSAAAGDAAIGHAGGVLINEMADYQAKVEQHQVDMTSNEATNKFDVLRRGELAEARKYQGDPSTIYDQIDKSKQGKIEDILKQYPDASPRLQQAIHQKIAARDYILNDRQATQQGLQQENWNNKNTEATLYLNKQSAMDESAKITVGDPKSLESFSKMVDKQKSDAIDSFGPGAYVRNPVTGELDLAPKTKMKMLQSTSDMIKDTVETLDRSGKIDESKMILDKHVADVDSKTMAALLTDHKDKHLDVKAATLSEGIISKSQNPTEMMAQVNKIEDPLLKQKTRALISKYGTEKDQNDKQAGEYYTNLITSYVQNKNKSSDISQHITTKDQFDTDKTIQGYLQGAGTKLTPKMRNNIVEDVAGGPKVSSESAVVKLMSKVADGSIGDIKDSEQPHEFAGLKDSDRKYFRQKIEQSKDPNSADAKKRDQFMTTNLTKELQAAGVIEKQITGKGTYSDEDEIKIHEAFSNMVPLMEATHDKSQTGQLMIVKQFVADHVKDKVFTASPQKPAQGPTAVKSPAPTPTPAAKGPLPTDKNGWLLKFAKEKGHAFGKESGDDMVQFKKDSGAQ